MKHWRQFKTEITRLRSGVILLLLLLALTSIAFAEGNSYTMSLRPSSESVASGDTIQLAVQVHNDGWPQSGDAEVAAFQAKLEYDRASLEYVSVEIPEGTMGDFSPDSGLVLGYGQGHRFQETLDCAVLTMKVADGVSGEIPVTLKDPVLGRQDATPLPVSPAGSLTLHVGDAASGETSSAQNGDGAVAGTEQSGQSAVSASGNNGAGSISSGQSGSRSDSSYATGESNASSGKNSGNGASEKKSESGTKKPGTSTGTNAASSDNGNGESSADASDQGTSESAGDTSSSETGGTDAVLSGKTADGEQDGPPGPGLWLLWGIVPVAAAAVAGIWIWRKRRR